jgi:hypothetical protein
MSEKQKVEVFLTKSTKEKLRQRSKELGTTMAEVIKRLLDDFLK